LITRGFRIGIPEVFALIKPDNPRSQAVARRLGMRHLGRTTRYHETEYELFHLVAAGTREPHRNSVAYGRLRARS
jgi:RimJ/RimL family protein N-acetyltransferase